MFVPFPIPDRPASPAAHRKFRVTTAALFVIALAAALLQATPAAVLPASKTSSLWGIVVGLAAMSVFIEWRWARTARRDRSRLTASRTPSA